MEQTRKDRNGGRALVRLAGRVALTLAVVALAAGGVALGRAELTRRAEAAPTPDAAPAIPVVTAPLRIEDSYEVRRAFAGQIEAQKAVTAGFELAGRVDAVLADEGERVRAGQVLARLDTALLQAERDRLAASKSAAEAQLTFALQTLDRRENLAARGFATRADLDGAEAARDELTGRIAEIDAAIAAVDIRIGKSTIAAPFDGRVASRFVDGGEALGAGQPVIAIVEDRAPQLRVGLPLGIGEDALGAVEVELAGRTLPARLIALRPDIDPVTRTRTALFALDTGDRPVFGQTARLLLRETVPVRGLWLPLTSLKEGQRGQWTVLMVDAGDTVRPAPVEILHAESDRVFVRGAFPEGARLIVGGPQRVTPGQRVATAN